MFDVGSTKSMHLDCLCQHVGVGMGDHLRAVRANELALATGCSPGSSSG
jgi:hypothetical protein